MKWTAAIPILQTLVKLWRRRAQRKAKRRREDNETAAWLADWQCDRLNEDLREHHQGRNPTTRITIDPKPKKPTKERQEATPHDM